MTLKNRIEMMESILNKEYLHLMDVADSNGSESLRQRILGICFAQELVDAVLDNNTDRLEFIERMQERRR